MVQQMIFKGVLKTQSNILDKLTAKILIIS